MLKSDLGFIAEQQILMGCHLNIGTVQNFDVQPGESDPEIIY